MTPRNSIEMFHLVFLRALAAKGDDKAHIALKGGCNLRFYFASIRYSEDIDFDVAVVAKDTLRNKVERLLRSPLVQAPLKTKGIELIETSAPKQTETTQRWKVGLQVPGIDVPVRTKIEFSRRGPITGATFEAADREVLRPYGLTPILAMHYATHAAIAQKVHALANRAEPQARDLFDLNLLFARPESEQLDLDDEQRAWLPPAIENATGISYDEHVAKVVAYLDPAQSDLYAARPSFEATQETVVARLEGLR